MDPQLSTDGIDEILRVMLSGVPPWGTFTPDGTGSIRIRTTDTGASWLVTTGRFTGTSPNTGTAYDEPALDVAAQDDDSPAAATISGAAADVDCRLWNRPPMGSVERSGDPALLAAFDAVLAEGVQ
jgi:hypothetical protein